MSARTLTIVGLLISSLAFGEIPYRVTFEDSNKRIESDRAAFLANLDAAISDWSRFISSKGTLWIHIDVTDLTATGRFSGGSTGSVFIRDEGELHIFEKSGTYKMRTGKSVDASKPDIVIHVQPEFLKSSYWIDPHPKLRTDPVPADKIDLVTVLAHELGHGFGIEGWLDLKTGSLPKDKGISPYDKLILNLAAHAPTFSGPLAKKIYGSEVPVSFFMNDMEHVNLNHKGKVYPAVLNYSQNIYHLGRFNPMLDESDLSFFSVMAGVWESPDASPSVGWRIPVNGLDAAVVRDLGVPAFGDAVKTKK